MQLNGQLIDAGGQLLYLNRARRLTWGGYVAHSTLVGAAATYDDATFNSGNQQVAGTIVAQYIQRQLVDEARGVLQYPLSTTRRLEFNVGAERVGFRSDVDSLFVVGNQVVGEVKARFPGSSALTLASATAAFVGDYSFFGYTSPIAGGRYRFEVAPYVGSLKFATALADYRRYFFHQPFTLAVRGLHYGRYGNDAETNVLQPLYIGQPQLVRGYDAESFTTADCTPVTGTTSQSGCPEFDRLNGSRIAVASAELRIPLFGSERLGLIRFPYLPTEIAPFVDAGVAWSRGQNPVFKFAERTTERVPVVSTGVTARFNLFGYAVVELFYAHPFQRPGRGHTFGFQLAPGW